ncbi:fimbria/pilus outer membrane usher protein [Serratia fonticola]
MSIPKCLPSLIFAISSIYHADALSNTESFTFKSSMKRISTDIDPFLFDKEGGQLPGIYIIDIYINDILMANRKIRFELSGNALIPCISDELLGSYGVNVGQLPADTKNCDAIAKINDAKFSYKFDQLKLFIYIPQILIIKNDEMNAKKNEWDDGVNAFFTNYNLYFNSYRFSGNEVKSENLSFSNGLNLGAWRIRNYATMMKSAQEKRRFESSSLYSQRRIDSVKGTLTAGEFNTSSDVFQSIPVTGIQIRTNEAFLSNEQRIYAPIIYGVARTNARVEVIQSGMTIYKRNIAAGAFALDDVIPFSGGDFDVFVYETDGEPQIINIPFAKTPGILRKNTFKYSMTIGEYNSEKKGILNGDIIAQLTASYGLTSTFTLYGGTQLTDDYHSIAAGAALNGGQLGALSADATHALAKSKITGRYRIRYSKYADLTKSNFTFTGEFSEKRGFKKIGDFKYGQQDSCCSLRSNNNTRNNYIFSFSQPGYFRDMLTLGVNLSELSKGDDRKKSYFLSYNLPVGKVRLNGSFVHSEREDRSRSLFSNTLNLGVSIPFSALGDNGKVSYSQRSISNKLPVHNLSVSGKPYGENFDWSVSNTLSESPSTGNSGYLYSRYKSGYGELYGNYGYGKNRNNMGGGISGGVVLHQDGLTVSQTISEPMVLIDAKGAGAIGIVGSHGSMTNRTGFGILSNLQPYHKNTVSLDPLSYSDDVSIDISNATVFPTEGALVKAKFNVKIGARVLMKLNRRGGGVVPFGAVVSSIPGTGEDKTGIVGDGGQVYLTGMPKSGVVKVKWGRGAEQSCEAPYSLPDNKSISGLYDVDALCQ